MAQLPQHHDPIDDGAVALVTGIVDDARALLDAQLVAVREDLAASLHRISVSVRASLIALAALVVAAIALGAAVGASLMAVGLPAWAATWLLTGIAGAIGGVLAARARRHPFSIEPAAVAAGRVTPFTIRSAS
jgi:hypothetical protein